MFKGRIHAVRVYDRVLTVAELRRNKEIDYARFYGTAGLSTETDLVEVRSEVPGIALDESASVPPFAVWIIVPLKPVRSPTSCTLFKESVTVPE